MDSRFLEHGISGKGRNRSRNIGGSNKRHNSDHGKATVIQLSASLDLHRVFIDRSEVDWGEDNSWKFSAFGVVNSIGLADNFSKEERSVDLLLSFCQEILRST
jgi:hypothetical protein